MQKILLPLFFVCSHFIAFAQSHGVSPYWQNAAVKLPKEGIVAEGSIGNSLIRKSNEELILFYNDSLSDGKKKINMLNSTDNGLNWSGPELFPPLKEKWGMNAAAAIDHNDNIHVVWAAEFSTQSKIYYARLDSGATSWSSAFLISDQLSFYASGASITVDLKNRVHVFWMDGNPDELSTISDVWYRQSPDGGYNWNSSIPLSTIDSLHSAFPRADFAGTSSDTLAIAWRNEVNVGEWKWDVKGSFSTNGGLNWQEKLIADNTQTSEWDPMTTVDKNGNIHLGVMEWAPNMSIVWYQRSSDAGATWELKDTIYSKRSKFPFFTYDETKDILWYFFRTDTTLSNGVEMSDFAGRYSANQGYTWSDEEYVTDVWVNPTATDTRYSNVIVDNTGFVHVYYSFKDTTLANGETTMYYQQRSEVPEIPFSAFVFVNEISCKGVNDGELIAVAQGGVQPYTYLWITGATTQSISGLKAGNYSVKIKDANGNVVKTNGMLSNPSLINAAATIEMVNCHDGMDGSIGLSVSGGSSPYNFLWSNGMETEDVSKLVAGNYSVTITDNHSCEKTFSYTISQPDSIAITASTSVICNYGGLGDIDIAVNGGTSPYSYVWSNGATTQDLTDVSPGNYVLTLADANSCKKLSSFGLSQANPISISTSKKDVSCNGGNNGSIDITVSGGSSPYAYQWSNGSSSQDVTGFYSGTYSVTVTDINLCQSTKSINVNQPSAISIKGIVTNESCKTNTVGSISISVNGGTSPYTYLWSNGSTLEDLLDVEPATYSVTINDKNLCTQSATFTVNETDPFKLNASITNPSCSSCMDGKITLTVTSGNSPYSYLWSNGSTSKTLSGIGNGTYSVTVTDVNSCSLTESYLVSNTNKATTIENLNSSSGDITIFPNPIIDNLNIQVSAFDEEEFYVDVYNEIGEIICQNKFEINNNEKTYHINMEAYTNGIYYLFMYSTNHVVYRQKIIKSNSSKNHN